MTKRNTIGFDELPLGKGVEMLNSDANGLVALNKPHGLLSHPNTGSEEADRGRSLLRADYDHDAECYEWTNAKGVACKAWLVNRLDSPTSGVILIALDETLADSVKALFSTHVVSKRYYALVKRVPKSMIGDWKDQLQKDVYKGGRLHKGGQKISARTHFQVVRKATGTLSLALLKLNPVTGRTHQLRVQCAKHGHPIIGDRTYGSFSFNKEVSTASGERRLMLHSGETTLEYQYGGSRHSFRAEAPMPDVFKRLLNFRSTHSARMASSRPPKRVLGVKPKPKISSVLKKRRFKA